MPPNSDAAVYPKTSLVIWLSLAAVELVKPASWATSTDLDRWIEMNKE